MNSSLCFSRSFFVVLAACLAAFGPVARAETKATATLSQTTIAPGDAISLTIDVSGVQQLTPPQVIEVEGLDVHYSGYQQSTRIENGRVERSVTLTYVVSGNTPGAFIIPAVEIKTGSGVLKTDPVHLRVETPAPGTQKPAANGDEPLTFVQIEVPKKTVFLGEAVPVVVRLYVDKRIRWRFEEMPVLEGEGFTKVKFPRPREDTVRKDGRDYEVLTFRTSISPGKAGTVTLGPLDVSFVASIPRAKRARPRNPLDLFDDGFFNEPFGPFGQMERRKVAAEPVELEVKPLPVAGRPADFSGAIGKFEMAVEGSPKQVKVGDPVTLKMHITGSGNFDRVNAPTLVEPKGWHAYEPSNVFSPNDEILTNGTKSFEMAVVPEEKKTQMPQVRFSYFDSATEKYVTLTSDPAPLNVEGGTPPAPAPIAKANPEPEPPPAPEPPKEVVQDIAGLKYEFGAARDSFEPSYRSRVFWVAQGVPALALLGFFGARFFRKDEAKSRAAALKRERDELWRKVRSESGHAEFFQAAARLVQVETAMATGRADASVDAQTARASAKLDNEAAAGIDEIFSKRAELLYAGSMRSDGRISESEKGRALTALERLQEAYARR